MTVWIVLVDYNGLDDTRRCLTSLAALADPARVVVVDNAGKRDVAAELAPVFPWADFVRAPANGGWAGGNNVGLRHALERGADWVVLLNNDTVASPHLVGRLLAAARVQPSYGVLGPVIRYLAPPHEVQTDGVVFNRPDRPGFFQRHPVPLATTDPPTVAPVDIVNGCCLCVRADVVKRIGFIDEGFFLIHEESDYCLRAQRAGFGNGVIAEALVWHKGSSTFKREGSKLQRYFDARNIPRLLLKHGGGSGRRPAWRAWGHFVRYAYHRYALEREGGFDGPANAVLDGLYDAATRRFGGYRPPGGRPGVEVLRTMFSGAWRLAGGTRARYDTC